jgi:hypothetical protein
MTIIDVFIIITWAAVVFLVVALLAGAALIAAIIRHWKG